MLKDIVAEPSTHRMRSNASAAAKDVWAVPLAPPTTATRSGSNCPPTTAAAWSKFRSAGASRSTREAGAQRLHAFSGNAAATAAGSKFKPAAGATTMPRSTRSSRSLRRRGRCLPPSPRSALPAPRAMSRRRAAPERFAKFPERIPALSISAPRAAALPKADHIPAGVCAGSVAGARPWRRSSPAGPRTRCRANAGPNTRINGVS